MNLKKYCAILIFFLGFMGTVRCVYGEKLPIEEGVDRLTYDEIAEVFQDQPDYILFDDEQNMVNDTDGSKKVVSVLGDSIATFQYYSLWQNYCEYYTEEHMSVHDTWWLHYIDSHGMQLGVNDSLGSSRVAWDEKTYPVPSYLGPDRAMASDYRIQNLGINGTPDVILFFGGTNDLGVTELGEFRPDNTTLSIKTFADAYQTAILKMKHYYPNVEIIAVTPYYWPGIETELVDSYCDMILSICEYYGIQCTDLRKAGLRFPQDMFGPGYDHPNEYGMKKIWHLMEYGRPLFITNGIYILKNDDSGITAGMTLSTSEAYEGTTYCWEISNAETGEFIWSSGELESNWLTWKPDQSGEYNLYCVAENGYGEVTEYTQLIEFRGPEDNEGIQCAGITWMAQDDYLDLGVAYISVDENPEFKWMSYHVDTGQWKTIKNWSQSNWVSWKDEPGVYWLYVTGRTKDRTSSFEKTIAFQYFPGHAQITGTYAGWDDSGQILLGCASTLSTAKYEFKIYNLDTQQWFWGSGRTGAWVTWSPDNGNYWLHYECYSDDGRLLDTRTYCFTVQEM